MNSYVIILEHKLYLNLLKFSDLKKSKTSLKIVTIYVKFLCSEGHFNMLSGMVEIIIMFNLITYHSALFTGLSMKFERYFLYKNIY